MYDVVTNPNKPEPSKRVKILPFLFCKIFLLPALPRNPHEGVTAPTYPPKPTQIFPCAMPATRQSRDRRGNQTPITQNGRTTRTRAATRSDAVPSIEKVESLADHEFVRLDNDKGESDVFRPGDW
jgi:hypothetical protein